MNLAVNMDMTKESKPFEMMSDSDKYNLFIKTAVLNEFLRLHGKNLTPKSYKELTDIKHGSAFKRLNLDLKIIETAFLKIIHLKD